MQNVMSGQHVADQCSLREKVVLPGKFESIRGMKIAFSMDLDYFAIAPDVQKNTLEAVRTLRRLGAKVEEVSLGWNSGVETEWLRWIATDGRVLPSKEERAQAAEAEVARLRAELDRLRAGS